MMRPAINDGHMIKCATCGHLATHQNRVEIFCREQDAETGTLVTVDLTIGGKERPNNEFGESGKPEIISAESTLPNNPSWRRHGLTVQLWCERGTCPPTLVHIFQHKGVTYCEVEAKLYE